ALKQGLREKLEEPILALTARAGLEDTLRLVAESLRAIEPPDLPEPLAVFQELNCLVGRLKRKLAESPSTFSDWRDLLQRLHHASVELVTRTESLAAILHEPIDDLLHWSRCFDEQVHGRSEELAGVAPWLELLDKAKDPSLSDTTQQGRERWLTGGGVGEMAGRSGSLGEENENGELSQVPVPLREALERSTAAELGERCQRLAERAMALAAGMDFRVLYNDQRHLFSIGYNLGTGRLDNAHYDLLASEACLTSFLTIGRGEAPRRHWFQLGRLLTRAGNGVALLSWGGTMFEYLMPRLFLRPYDGTLLQESWKAAVARHVEYGRDHRVPWGISESGFNALDAALDYQYQSFGAPGLGLKRGLGSDLVVAPYATVLALAVEPVAAVRNLHALAAERADGGYGFYEALDYTHDRPPSVSPPKR